MEDWQVVLNAYREEAAVLQPTDGAALAAALTVAMDLVVPDAALKDAEGLDERLLMLQRKVTRMQLRDLAAELKANG